jgi:hypothetical protein
MFFSVVLFSRFKATVSADRDVSFPSAAFAIIPDTLIPCYLDKR